ncbi:MAG: oxaloacetate decarboxylase [Clostridia bacterium]|nr:oxaloacetate decarboxylase [Clostridia bacterium]
MFEPQRFVGNLKYMLSGMIGIFVVIGLIVIVTVILNKVTSHGGKK